MSKKILNCYIKYDDYYILRIESRKYGIFDFKIDNEDYEKCKKYHWSVNRFNRKSEIDYFYATNTDLGLLHRYIMDVKTKSVVDHINGDTLDTRKQNLQICSYSNNLCKQRKKLTNKSGQTGVIWNKHLLKPKWMAYICVNSKQITLGYFDKYEDAVKARKDAEPKYYGEFTPIK